MFGWFGLFNFRCLRWDRAVDDRAEVVQRSHLQERQFEFIGLNQLGHLLCIKCFDLGSRCSQEATQGSLLAAGQRDLSLHRLEKIQFLKLRAVSLRPHELRLIITKELQHILQVRSLLAFIGEQALATAFGVTSRPAFVDAQGKLRTNAGM